MQEKLLRNSISGSAHQAPEFEGKVVLHGLSACSGVLSSCAIAAITGGSMDKSPPELKSSLRKMMCERTCLSPTREVLGARHTAATASACSPDSSAE